MKRKIQNFAAVVADVMAAERPVAERAVLRAAGGGELEVAEMQLEEAERAEALREVAPPEGENIRHLAQLMRGQPLHMAETRVLSYPRTPHDRALWAAARELVSPEVRKRAEAKVVALSPLAPRILQIEAEAAALRVALEVARREAHVAAVIASGRCRIRADGALENVPKPPKVRQRNEPCANHVFWKVDCPGCQGDAPRGRACANHADPWPACKNCRPAEKGTR